jgi:Eukaryotic aspartyl protease
MGWALNELVQAVLNAANATFDETGLPVVSCDKISELPHLVFDFGGQEIALNGEDYIGEAEWLFCFRGPYCSPLIGSSLRDDNRIVLGPSLLKKAYSVFNWDERIVLCKSRTRSQCRHLLTDALSCNWQTSLLWEDSAVLPDVIPSFKPPLAFSPKRIDSFPARTCLLVLWASIFIAEACVRKRHPAFMFWFVIE